MVSQRLHSLDTAGCHLSSWISMATWPCAEMVSEAAEQLLQAEVVSSSRVCWLGSGETVGYQRPVSEESSAAGLDVRVAGRCGRVGHAA